jgi:hypothetical protein
MPAGLPAPPAACQPNSKIVHLETLKAVIEACTVSGAADAVLRMLARDVPHLEQAIQRVRATAPVDRTESVIVLSRLLDRPRP